MIQPKNKLKITHSKLEETKDPIGLMLTKIGDNNYHEYIVEDIDLVRHNIDKFRELVVSEDNVSSCNKLIINKLFYLEYSTPGKRQEENILSILNV